MPAKVNRWFLHQRKGDNLLEDARSGDIVIPVMGATGSGKSTFINHIIGQPIMEVGHDLASCTKQLKYHVIDPIPEHPGLEGRRLILVDTPGFGDTYLPDTEILRLIAVWLASSYDDKTTVAGVVYLHEIGMTRITGTGLGNIEIFEKLCGKDSLSNVVLGTTKSELFQPEVVEFREKDLASKYWKDMVAAGSTLRRVGNNSKSTWDVIDLILSSFIARNQPCNALCIQKELVDLGKSIPATDAGKELRRQLQNLLKQQKRGLEKFDKGDDSESQRRFAKEMAITLGQIKALHIPISQRVLSFFGL